MKRPALILFVGLLLACLAYYGGYFVGTAKQRALLRSDVPELAWLREEFKLGEAEFQRIVELHESYLPGCAMRCARIDAKNAELKALLGKGGTVTGDVEKKLAEAADLRVECQTAMLQHFIAVSKAMPPAQGKRYLAWVEQQTFMPEHRMADHH